MQNIIEQPDLSGSGAAPVVAGEPGNAKPAEAKGTVRYFTEGELLPWKGQWWRIHLDAETRRIYIEAVKPTAAEEKRANAISRWKRRHPHARAEYQGRGRSYFSYKGSNGAPVGRS